MPKLDPQAQKKISAFCKKKKPAAVKLSAQKVKKRAETALAKAKWSVKQASPPEKKAYAEVEQAVVEMCAEEGLKEVHKAMSEAKVEKAKKEVKARIKQRMARIQRTKQRAKKALAKLPPQPAQAVEKELDSAFKSALKFWKDLEADARKEGLAG